MNRHEREELDAHITGQYEDNEPEFCPCPNLAGDCDGNHCAHAYISWHGSRGECQDCGEIVSAPNPDTDAILTKLFNQWRDDITHGRECTIPVRHDATECNGEHHDPERWTHE